jgi:hypothetical protein
MNQPHEECGFRLTCGLQGCCCMNEGRERGTIVPNGWHTTVAAWVEFIGIFLRASFYRDVK